MMHLRTWLSLSMALVVSLAGCSEIPFADWGIADPRTRRSWREDERYGPTFATKRQQLREQRSAIARLRPEEQETQAAELAARLREEQHAVLKIEILRTLAEIPSQVATDAIRTAMNDADPDVRVVVCQAWGRRGGDESRQMLAHMLGSDTDHDVRIAATRELGRFKDDPEAMKALRLAIDDNSPAMQYRAVESLRSISGRDYGENLIAWREYIDGGNPPEQPPPNWAARLKRWY